MKNLVLVISLACTPLTGLSNLLTADIIANSCSQDSGVHSQESYLQYGERLSQTLSQLSPQQLERVFLTNSQVVESQVESQVSIGDAETVNEFLDLSPIGFAPNSPNINEDSLQELDQVFLFLSENPSANILIEGHTDGGGVSNEILSTGRADSARDYLIGLGVDPERIEAVGLSNTNRLFPTDAPREDRILNRRIEILLTE